MIPPILWQTSKTGKFPDALIDCQASWEASNPGLTRYVYDDAQCANFILEHFGGRIYELYMELPLPVMRADFWRIAVIYVHGGFYADIDTQMHVDAFDLLEESNEAVFMIENGNIGNFFFAAKPGHPILKATIERMIKNAEDPGKFDPQDFGMHPLHAQVIKSCKIKNKAYVSTSKIAFLDCRELEGKHQLRHLCFSKDLENNLSWRKMNIELTEARQKACNITFFTTFNKSGYDLYGAEWADSFRKISKLYPSFKAVIYYEGFYPLEKYSNIEWIDFKKALPEHERWKSEYLEKNNHCDYVRTMTVRFSHKAFVIQQMLSKRKDDYLIWLDGDCVFLDADYSGFPGELVSNSLVACQVEETGHDNHVESGILIFNGKHKSLADFAALLRAEYKVENIINRMEPYDGFLIYQALLKGAFEYTNLNAIHGLGGIQSDPTMTFLHPEIKSRFVHNIGLTGKTQYQKWNKVKDVDNVYKMMQNIFGGVSTDSKKDKIKEKFQKLKAMRPAVL